jgi:hypothetical protein
VKVIESASSLWKNNYFFDDSESVQYHPSLHNFGAWKEWCISLQKIVSSNLARVLGLYTMKIVFRFCVYLSEINVDFLKVLYISLLSWRQSYHCSVFHYNKSVCSLECVLIENIYIFKNALGWLLSWTFLHVTTRDPRIGWLCNQWGM